MNPWLDITLPLSNGLPPWPGDEPFHREVTAEIGVGGAHCNLSALQMGSHTGTHVDAQKHFVAGGAGVDSISLEILIGAAFVLDLSSKTEHIGASDLEGRIPAGAQRVLIKTRNSQHAGDGVFHEDFLALKLSATHHLLGLGIKLLGVDGYSIAPFHALPDIHQVFLGAGSVALENIDLSLIQEGWYDFVCLPLKIADGDGAPARALIRKREA